MPKNLINILDLVTLKVLSTWKMNYFQRQRLFYLFNQFGFVIIEHEQLCKNQDIKENLLYLSKFFGSVKNERHSYADKKQRSRHCLPSLAL